MKISKVVFQKKSVKANRKRHICTKNKKRVDFLKCFCGFCANKKILKLRNEEKNKKKTKKTKQKKQNKTKKIN